MPLVKVIRRAEESTLTIHGSDGGGVTDGLPVAISLVSRTRKGQESRTERQSGDAGPGRG